MRKSSAACAALLVALPCKGMGQELQRIDDRWSHYLNARFGTSVDVPNIFTPADPAPMNGDGRSFNAADGAELRIFGSYGATVVTENFAVYKTWLLDHLQADGVTVTYKVQGKDWIAVSGTKDGTVVYTKAIEGCGATHEMWIEYPEARKQSYDPLIGRLARSLRCMP